MVEAEAEVLLFHPLEEAAIARAIATPLPQALRCWPKLARTRKNLRSHPTEYC